MSANNFASRRTATPLRTAIVYLGGILLGSILIFYFLYQARFILTGPQIQLVNEPETVQSKRVVALEGHVQNITNITLNGRPIYTDERGYFKEAVVLETGYTIATLEATDRYGRSARVAKSFVYSPLSRLP